MWRPFARAYMKLGDYLCIYFFHHYSIEYFFCFLSLGVWVSAIFREIFRINQSKMVATSLRHYCIQIIERRSGCARKVLFVGPLLIFRPPRMFVMSNWNKFVELGANRNRETWIFFLFSTKTHWINFREQDWIYLGGTWKSRSWEKYYHQMNREATIKAQDILWTIIIWFAPTLELVAKADRSSPCNPCCTTRTLDAGQIFFVTGKIDKESKPRTLYWNNVYVDNGIDTFYRSVFGSKHSRENSTLLHMLRQKCNSWFLGWSSSNWNW